MKMYHLVEAESLWALSQKGAVNLPQVKTLQDKLRAAGFDPGASDGWYGKKTAAAVRAYQQANNLTVDGDAGPQTLGKLGMGGANKTPPRETPPEETPPAPAPRQTATEPPDEPAQTTRSEPEPTTRTEPTTRSEPEPAPTQREPEQTTTTRDPEPASDTAQYIDVGDARSRRDMRDAIRTLSNREPDIGFSFQSYNVMRVGSPNSHQLEITLDDTNDLNAMDYARNVQSYRPRIQAIEDLLQNLRGDAEIYYSIRFESGVPVADGDLILDPMPSNESINRLSTLAGL